MTGKNGTGNGFQGRASALNETQGNSRKEEDGAIAYNELEKSYLDYVRASTKHSTVKAVEERVRLYLRPALKGARIPLTAAQEIHLKAQLNEKQINQSYKRSLFITYAQMVNHARNVLGIESARVKIKGFRRPPKEIHTIWNFQQYEAFRKTLKDTEEKAFFDLLYYGGLRRGEALALLDTDLIGGNKIAITKTFSKGETTTTKTNAGTRIVKLPPEIYAELEEQAEKKGKLFRGLSFTSLKRTLDRGAKEAELPRARIHDLRHSHITMLLYQGITPQGIAHRVGQADTNTLFNTYAGYLTREDETICRFLEKEIKKSTR